MRHAAFVPFTFAVVACLGWVACSAQRLPAGTPPPEYEPPVISPWLADGSDAGKQSAPAPSNAVSAEPLPAKSPAAAELSPDAGVR